MMSLFREDFFEAAGWQELCGSKDTSLRNNHSSTGEDTCPALFPHHVL